MPQLENERKLAERVKELDCLYALAKITQAYERPLPEILEEALKVVPTGWQFPDSAQVLVQLDDLEHGIVTNNGYAMHAALKVDHVQRGRIVVSYPDAGIAGAEPLFLPEEQQLLDKIAADLSTAIERHERRQQQEMLELRMRSNDRLTILAEITAGIAHEMNTPLGNVLGYAELLKKNETGPARRSDLQRIIDSALIGREIVKKLMYFSCEMPAHFQLADANKALRDVLHLLEHRLEQQNVSVSWYLGTELPTVRVDQVQFAQVVSNLVLNAMAAMPKGGTITISSQVQDDWVSIAITDTGSGIAPADLKKIFQPFFTTKPTGEGTGLGLSVVHGIMKGHRGQVSAASTLGAGTTFTILFPVSSS
ncbi:MAG: sensor histidine kinase [Flavobacteriales bacterium]